MKAMLVLENGTVFYGKAFGSYKKTLGEVVFNTSMAGYQEVFTDPSYCGQIVTMTYPLIGNYGINRDDDESMRPYIHGVVVREQASAPSHWRSKMTLDQWLKKHDIPGIAGVDTRKLTRMLRRYGTMKGILAPADMPMEKIREMFRQPLMKDQVQTVSTKKTYRCAGSGPRVVVMDFGCKRGILRELNDRGCDTIVVSYRTSAEEIERYEPDGILLSNGPGDPKNVPEAVQTIRKLSEKYPLMGICLGHQLFALAYGADTEKMKFGHRGGNHPVKEIATNRTYITSQNHGYTVKRESLSGTELALTHVALNDGTVEGLRHTRFPAFSVQYHPEAAPGPADSGYLFDRFLELMAEHKKDVKSYEKIGT